MVVAGTDCFAGCRYDFSFDELATKTVLEVPAAAPATSRHDTSPNLRFGEAVHLCAVVDGALFYVNKVGRSTFAACRSPIRVNSVVFEPAHGPTSTSGLQARH